MSYRIADPMKVGLHDRLLNTTKAQPDLRAGHRAKTATRIVFIPWNTADGHEWTAKCQNWATEYAKKGKTLHIVNHGQVTDLLRNASDDPEAVVYIRGHGSPSSPFIGTRDTAPSGAITETKLPIEEACRRLMQMGLNPRFAGTIKFFFCYSGTIWQDVKGEANAIIKKWEDDTAFQKQRGLHHLIKPCPELPRGKSLARAGADFLRSKGFTKCIFYGYLGPLAAEMTDDPKEFDNVTDGASHKQVRLDSDLKGARPAAAGDHLHVRASAGRIRV